MLGNTGDAADFPVETGFGGSISDADASGAYATEAGNPIAKAGRIYGDPTRAAMRGAERG